MNNKNNITVKELTELLHELVRVKYNNSLGYAYVSGVLEAILDWELKGLNSINLQETINNCYSRNKKDLEALLLTSSETCEAGASQ